MQGNYVHSVTLRMDPGADSAAPGAAVTAALCGDWEHPPPCPLAPHHTAAEEDGGLLRLRTIFAADPALEGEVRRRIEAALAAGSVQRPDGAVSRWTFVHAEAGELTTAERAQARRITGA